MRRKTDDNKVYIEQALSEWAATQPAGMQQKVRDLLVRLHPILEEQRGRKVVT